MMKLLGFKYVETSGRGEVIEYVVLTKVKNKYYIDWFSYSKKEVENYKEKYSGQKRERFEITKKIDKFLNEIESFNIKDWKKEYMGMEFFPPIGSWKLHITTNTYNVVTSGSGDYPENFREFFNSFKRMCEKK
ncbi:MAG: hypothetical protein Q3988_00435 [Gemella sp.]|nr:hypothetical protein [Gemella sp.]